MNNANDMRTTIPAVIGAIFMVISILMPDKVTSEDVTAIQAAASSIVAGIGTLILVITGIFSRGGTDPAH